MKRFMVLYLVPTNVIEQWSKTEPAKKKEEEGKMQAAWQAWMREHGKMIVDSGAGGKTQCVTAGKTMDTKNEIMIYSFVEAETHEAASKPFETHPHLQIPESRIEVMEVRSMGGKPE